MAVPSGHGERLVTKCGTGTADEAQLETLIKQAWRAALSDPKERADIATLLGAKENELSPDEPPFHAELTGAGFTGGEVLIAVAAGFVLGGAKDIGSAAGKAAARRLRELWNDYIYDRVSPPGSGKLGRSKDEAEES
jgi:hypothetical protein